MRPAATLLAACLSLPAAAQRQPSGLSPESPPHGGSVGTRPRFLLRVTGGDVEKLRFRIELSSDRFLTIAYTFDQVKDESGWAYTVLDDRSPGAAYFARQALAGGSYHWRVASWDGLSWKESPDWFQLLIDDVPPADVEGVSLDRQDGACVRVSWRPVTLDRDGRTERVALYHVYRHATKGPTRPIRPHEAGRTASLTFEDCDPEGGERPVLFYRVVAEDEAGNLAGRKF